MRRRVCQNVIAGTLRHHVSLKVRETAECPNVSSAARSSSRDCDADGAESESDSPPLEGVVRGLWHKANHID